MLRTQVEVTALTDAKSAMRRPEELAFLKRRRRRERRRRKRRRRRMKGRSF